MFHVWITMLIFTNTVSSFPCYTYCKTEFFHHLIVFKVLPSPGYSISSFSGRIFFLSFPTCFLFYVTVNKISYWWNSFLIFLIIDGGVILIHTPLPFFDLIWLCSWIWILISSDKWQSENCICLPGLSHNSLFLGTFPKLQKVTISFIVSVCPNGTTLPHWIDLNEIWYLRIFQKSVTKIHVTLKSDNNNGYFAWRPMLSEFFLEWEILQTNFVEKIKIHILCLTNVFTKSVPFMRQCGNLRARQETDNNIIWHVCFACRISKARIQTYTQNF